MTWNEIFLGAIILILQPFLIYLVRRATVYLDTRIEDVRIKEALKLVQEAAERAVTVTTQTYTDEVRKAGKWSAATAREAFDRAFAEAYMTINEDTKELAGKVTQDFNDYLCQLIEEQVKLQKEEFKEI